MRMNDHRAHVEIGADTNPRDELTERAEHRFRVLVLGDFSARTGGRPSLAARSIERVDRDGIDATIARIAPALRLSIDPDAIAERIEFTELDDFHPDHLLSRVPALVRLRALRATVESQPVSSRTSSAANAVDGGSLLDRILEGEAPIAPAGDASRHTDGDDLSDFVRRAVRPHVSREVDPSQRALVEQVDAVLAATLRVVLHHSEFQALEALWRGVDFFMRRCEADDATIGLLDIARAELFDAVMDTGRRRALMERVSRSDDGEPWTLVIAAFAFTGSDVAVLGQVATMAAESGVPWLAAAHSTLGGAETFADNGDVDDWDASPLAAWDALRREPGARYLGLALPRYLVRLPYGAENPVDALSFEELEGVAPPHASFLWGHPAFPCALVASTPVERGSPAPSQGTIDGLPVHIVHGNGDSAGLPCAETLLTQRAVMHLLDRGLIPLVSEREGDAIRIARLQSIADPPTPLPMRPALRDA